MIICEKSGLISLMLNAKNVCYNIEIYFLRKS